MHRWALAVMAAGGVLLGACDGKVAGGRADGAAVFAETCARCHGPDGVPSRAMVARLGVKDLTSAEVQALSDERIHSQIVNGSKNKQMPSFSYVLSEAQIEALIRYVRTLDDPHPAPTAAR